MATELDDIRRTLQERFGDPLTSTAPAEPLHESVTCQGCGCMMEVDGMTCSECGSMGPMDQKAPPGREKQVKALKKDPVCGTFVSAATAVQKTKGGETYYFCSTECRDKF